MALNQNIYRFASRGNRANCISKDNGSGISEDLKTRFCTKFHNQIIRYGVGLAMVKTSLNPSMAKFSSLQKVVKEPPFSCPFRKTLKLLSSV